MKIKHIIFLIHPGTYTTGVKVKPEDIHPNNYELYFEREQEVRQRWLAAISSLDKVTLFIQYGGPEYVGVEAVKQQLGEPNACYVPRYTGPLLEHYRLAAECIRSHMKEFNLELDPGTVTSEVWGASFEGCAADYSGAFAECLGLKRPPKIQFEMTVYDSRFLYGARRWEVIPLSGSDIEAWLFELHDGTGAAIFLARLSSLTFDKRPVLLHLDAQRIHVCNKLGFTVWPPAPWNKNLPDDICPYCLTTADNYWVRTVRMAFDDFRKVIAAAVVVDCKGGHDGSL